RVAIRQFQVPVEEVAGLLCGYVGQLLGFHCVILSWLLGCGYGLGIRAVTSSSLPRNLNCSSSPWKVPRAARYSFLFAWTMISARRTKIASLSVSANCINAYVICFC